jgi:hypothetical protein
MEHGTYSSPHEAMSKVGGELDTRTDQSDKTFELLETYYLYPDRLGDTYLNTTSLALEENARASCPIGHLLHCWIRMHSRICSMILHRFLVTAFQVLVHKERLDHKYDST